MDKKEIEQLRDSIKQKLENAEFEGRIKIDKDVLEQLLFDSFIGGNGYYDGKPIKIPVWSGKFLQKIDLSEVDFSNVFWGKKYIWDDIVEEKDCKKISSPSVIYYYTISEENTVDISIDYSNTNANIDLGKAFTMRIRDYDGKSSFYRDTIYIDNCNFENVDLSNSNFEGKTTNFLNSNLSNTNIRVNKDKSNVMEFCFMNNNDLSYLTVDLLELMDTYIIDAGVRKPFSCNWCKNSGLKIVCDKESLEKYRRCFDTDNRIEGFWENFREFFDDYNYIGCYFNGTLIESKEQLLELSTNTMKKLIDEYKKNTTQYKMDQLLNSIDEQMEGKKKKDINDMLNDKVEMIESSIDEQIKSKQ